MNYLNKIILLFVIVLFGTVIYLGITGGFSGLFILPILIIIGYAIYYLHRQFEKDEEERIKKQVDILIEDMEAENWMKDTFIPQTIKYGQKRRKVLIAYAFLFIISFYFLWQFISLGLMKALRDTLVASLVLALFIFYIKAVPVFYDRLLKFFPENIKKYNRGDWGRAYLFLFPLAFTLYIFFPFEKISDHLQNNLMNFPVFLLTYTFSFLSLYSIYYLIQDEQKKRKKDLENEVKDLLDSG